MLDLFLFLDIYTYVPSVFSFYYVFKCHSLCPLSFIFRPLNWNPTSYLFYFPFLLFHNPAANVNDLSGDTETRVHRIRTRSLSTLHSHLYIYTLMKRERVSLFPGISNICSTEDGLLCFLYLNSRCCARCSKLPWGFEMPASPPLVNFLASRLPQSIAFVFLVSQASMSRPLGAVM